MDVADIFTTTPAIADNDLVVLEDPTNNFIAPQALPLASQDRLPKEAVDTLNRLSAELTTEDLIDLNRKVSGEDPISPADAASGMALRQRVLSSPTGPWTGPATVVRSARSHPPAGWSMPRQGYQVRNVRNRLKAHQEEEVTVGLLSARKVVHR